MPEPQNPCPDISQSSSPWRGTRRSPVICSLPSLIPIPLYPVRPCPTHCCAGLDLLDSVSGRSAVLAGCLLAAARAVTFPCREKHPQVLEATTEHRSVSTLCCSFLLRLSHFWTQNG